MSREYTADLVVIGSGAAGLTGALVAAEGGAKVIVLEKTGLVGGTTAISGGGIWIPCNPLMASVGVEDSREEALEYMRACAGDHGDDDHVVALADQGKAMIAYLMARAGIEFQAFPPIGGMIDYRAWLPGAKHGGRALEPMGFSLSRLGDWGPRLRTDPRLKSANNLLAYYTERKHLLPMSAMKAPPADDSDIYWRGTALVGWLLEACLARNVEVLTEAEAGEIIKHGESIAGVRGRQGDDEVTIHAPNLLMATGGYGHNEELKRLWLNRPLHFTCENETNVGDGHLMGMAAGAQMAGLGDAWWLPHIPLGLDNGVANLAGTREDRILPHTMMVNASGKRFMNEATNYYDCGEAFGTKSGAGPRNFPAWFLFDQQGVDRYMLLAFKIPPGEKPDWLHRAATIEDLAKSIAVDPRTLKATVERFNGFAVSGVDEDFHRGENPWDVNWGDPDNKPNPCLGTIAKAPFYALPVYPGANSTRGGLRIDAKGRVLSARTGAPIAGFYASGNCSNGAVAGAYCGPGATLGPAMTFSYLAGLDICGRLGQPTCQPRA
jgi:3-oxosteroid 1-dehydrogenase